MHAVKMLWGHARKGIVPVVLIFCVFYIVVPWVAAALNRVALPIVSDKTWDIPITLLLFLAAAVACNVMIEWEVFQNFAKNYFVKIPLIGGLLLLFVIPRPDLEFVEVKTVPGTAPKEEGWEYAIELKKWEESGVVWYRVHTLGWAGRLYSRVGERNIRPTGCPKSDILARILSFGLL